MKTVKQSINKERSQTIRSIKLPKSILAVNAMTMLLCTLAIK